MRPWHCRIFHGRMLLGACFMGAYCWEHISWAHIFDHGRKLLGACCMGAYFLLWAHIAGRKFHGRIIAMVGANVTEFYTLPKTVLWVDQTYQPSASSAPHPLNTDCNHLKNQFANCLLMRLIRFTFHSDFFSL